MCDGEASCCPHRGGSALRISSNENAWDVRWEELLSAFESTPVALRRTL